MLRKIQKKKIIIFKRAAISFGIVLFTLSTFAAENANANETKAIVPSYGIQDKIIQEVPQLFKFQAKISQAKMPVRDGEFDKVSVKLLSGQEQNRVCVLENVDVQIKNSVLNLAFGRQINGTPSCDLASFIAASPSLSVQICINGKHCLKALEMGTVPYSLSATYSYHAQTATSSERAAQADYAHRITADRDLFVTNQVGVGYYDFYTPQSNVFSQTIFTGLTSDQSRFDVVMDNPENQGFIQWTPKKNSGNVLHICSKDKLENLLPLDGFLIHSNFTRIRGNAYVEGDEWVNRNLTVDKNLITTGNVDFFDKNSTMNVYPKTTFYGEVDIRPQGENPNPTIVIGKEDGEYDPVENELNIYTKTNFFGEVNLNPEKYESKWSSSWNDIYYNDGNVDIGQSLDVEGNVSVGQTLSVEGDESVEKSLSVGGNVTVGQYLSVKGYSDFLSNKNSGQIRVGRYSGENLRLYVDDINGRIEYNQDSDNNAGHHLYITNNAGGLGENDIRFQTGGADRLIIDRDGTVTASKLVVPNNSITEKKIKNDSVTNSKIKFQRREFFSDATQCGYTGCFQKLGTLDEFNMCFLTYVSSGSFCYTRNNSDGWYLVTGNINQKCGATCI